MDRQPEADAAHAQTPVIHLARDQEFRGLLESAPDAMVIIDRDGVIVLVNEQTEALFGYDRDEMVGRPVEMLVPEEIRGVHPQHRDGYFADSRTRPMGAGLELNARRKDGSEVPVDISLSTFDSAEGPLATAVVRDITDRRASEEKFRGLLESAPDAMVIVDQSGRIVLTNRQTEGMFGYSRDELVGQPVEILVPEDVRERHPGHRTSYFTDPRTRPMGVGLSLRGRKRDGTEFPVDIALSSIQSEGGTLATATVRDTTERHRLETELRDARDAADAASRAKTVFLSRVSHELRTPLNAVLGFAQLLEMEDLEEDQRESALHIARAGRHLLNLINEVIDIARIEANELTLSLEPVELAEIVNEAVELVRPLGVVEGITLSVQTERETFVHADRQRLRQVLLNLLANAVKYNRREGMVWVSWETTADGGTVVAVRDTGPGIPTQDLPRLFMPFDRMGAEQTDVEGTGVGLALSLRLAEAMGGTITVDSVLGTGSSFRLTLPPASEPVTAVSAATDDPVEDVSSTRDQARRVVLLVEDNLSNVRLVERILAHRPHWQLVHTVYGRSALDLAHRHHPDLVLLDLHLPDMPGVDVLRGLRGDPLAAECPVYVVSADATAGQRRLLRGVGADGYLTKPLDVREFLALLDAVPVRGGV
ncbi:MAG: PAS domain S-box protein [Actinomycetes bacterium]